MNYMYSLKKQKNDAANDYLFDLPHNMRVRLEYCPSRDMLKVFNYRTKKLMGYRHTLALQDIEFKVDERRVSTGRAGIVVGTIPETQLRREDIPYPQPEVVLDPTQYGPRFVTRCGLRTIANTKQALFYACGTIYIME